MSKEFIKPILRECKYCGSKNLVLENKSKLSIMEAPQVSLKCADCGKWIKWCPKDERKFYLKEVDKDHQIAELKAENERLKDENKVLKEIRGLKSKELKKRPHELTQKEAYQKGWENAISETIRTFEFNYGKDKVELVEERDKYFSDIYKIGGYKFTIEDLQQQLKDNTKQVCEKIKKWGDKHFNWFRDGTGYDEQDYNKLIGFNNAITKLLEFLDQIDNNI